MRVSWLSGSCSDFLWQYYKLYLTHGLSYLTHGRVMNMRWAGHHWLGGSLMHQKRVDGKCYCCKFHRGHFSELVPEDMWVAVREILVLCHQIHHHCRPKWLVSERLYCRWVDLEEICTTDLWLHFWLCCGHQSHHTGHHAQFSKFICVCICACVLCFKGP